MHTFSSLNKDFIDEYLHTLDLADFACVYFNEHTLQMKRLPKLSREDIINAFGRDDLFVTTNSDEMISWLGRVKKNNNVFLMMSSGNFDGVSFLDIARGLISDI